MMNTAKTIEQHLRETPLAHIETRALLSFVLKQPYSYLISHNDEALDSATYQHFFALCQARQNGVPLAYLLGEREFYGRMFNVSNAVLIPRFDTETLIEQCLVHIKTLKQPRILDLGTGSGIIAITLASERPDAQIIACDISEAALNIAQQNNQRHQTQVQFYCGSWFDALPPNTRPFDIIVSNPPYIAANDHHLKEGDLRFEPRNALTDEADGLTHFRHIIAHSPRFLNTNAKILFEHGYDQSLAVQTLLEKSEFTQIYTQHDLANQPRVTCGTFFANE